MEAKDHAVKHFATCPFNLSVTEETAHQSKESRERRESMARRLHIKTTSVANNDNAAWKAGPTAPANKHATSKISLKATAKAAEMKERLSPN